MTNILEYKLEDVNLETENDKMNFIENKVSEIKNGIIDSVAIFKYSRT